MKTTTIVCLVAATLLQSVHLRASSRRDTVRGALIGAATGALVSGLSSDVSSRTAIPLFAGVGALAGYSHHQYRNRDYYGYSYSPDWRVTYGIAPYHYPVRRHHRYHRQVRYTPAPVRVAPAPNPPAPQQSNQPANSPNRHPGVTRIPVSFTTPSGFPLTITITKVGNQYVGPRGETYAAMPSVEQLQAVYRP